MQTTAAIGNRQPPARGPEARHELEARQELAALLAGAEDLAAEFYDSTIELAVHLRARRAAAGQAVDVEAVILDLEACLRSTPPAFPEDVRPGVGRLTGAGLAAAIDKARSEFDRLIREHLAFARTALEGK
jgi:hypothetical protein